MGKNYNLVVEDEYLIEMSNFFKKTSQMAEGEIQTLLQAVEHATQRGLIKGKSADALEEFLGQIKLLSGSMLEYGKECSQLIDDFRKQIDEIDMWIY